MALFEKFGEFNTKEELDQKALELRTARDVDGIKVLAAENGIPEAYVDLFTSYEIDFLSDTVTVAIGKIEVEAKEMKIEGIIVDWLEYIKSRCFEMPAMAIAVRRKDRSLKGAIAAILKASSDQRYDMDADIVKLAGLGTQRISLGMPGSAEVKRIITKYYTR